MTRGRTGPIGELERLRRLAGFTATAFARAVGCTVGYVRNVELGREKPSPRFRAAACSLIASRLGEILFDPTDPTEEPWTRRKS
jgi:transcriptional regulator with XRE-family HTH domain